MRSRLAAFCHSILGIRSLALAAALLSAVFHSPVLRAQGPPQIPPGHADDVDVDVDGELEVQFVDSATGSRILHFLHVGNRRFDLKLDDDGPKFLTGTKVHAHGKLKGDTLDLTKGGGGSTQVQSLPTSNTFGEQKTLVLLINFQDYTAQSTDVGSAYSTTFSGASNFYLENTYGQTWLTGDVYGWFTLPMSSGSCDYNTMASLAETAATSAGINVGAYPRRIFAFPQIGACAWWGLGNVGGNPSRAWVNGSYAVKVVSHELGHNFGAYHSHSQPCDPSGCSSVEYGDDHDDMGQVSNGHFNAFQKERLGWLNYGSSPPIQTVSSGGNYHVDTYETPGTTPKALKILKGAGTYYYVENRTRTGWDGGDAAGVLIHSGSSTDGNTSYQLDFDPLTSNFNGLLGAGQTFTDASIGLSITVLTTDASGASLLVSYPGVPCASKAPTVTLSPGGTVMDAPGQLVSYNFTLKNNDDPNTCSAENFGFSGTVPNGWSGVLNAGSATVPPGGTTTIGFGVTPPATASGTGNVAAQASRLSGTGPGGSASGSVMVVSGLSVSLSIKSAGGGYNLTATVTGGSKPVSGVAVTFTVTDPTGKATTLTATTNSSGVASAKYTVKGKAARGTYQVRAVAASGSLSGSATGSFVE